MANPAMEVNEAEEIDYFNNRMSHQLDETPHDNRKLQGQAFVAPGVDGSDWSLDESDGKSGKVPNWKPYSNATVAGGEGGGGG